SAARSDSRISQCVDQRQVGAKTVPVAWTHESQIGSVMGSPDIQYSTVDQIELADEVAAGNKLKPITKSIKSLQPKENSRSSYHNRMQTTRSHFSLKITDPVEGNAKLLQNKYARPEFEFF